VSGKGFMLKMVRTKSFFVCSEIILASLKSAHNVIYLKCNLIQVTNLKTY